MLPARRRRKRLFKPQHALVAAVSNHAVCVGLGLTCAYDGKILAPLRLIERDLAKDFDTIDGQKFCAALVRCATLHYLRV